MKHNRDPESKTEIVSCTRQTHVEASRVSRTCVSTFTLTDLTGSSLRPKNPSKTCAPQGPPQCGCGRCKSASCGMSVLLFGLVLL